MTKDDLYDLHRDEIRILFYKEDIPPDQTVYVPDVISCQRRDWSCFILLLF